MRILDLNVILDDFQEFVHSEGAALHFIVADGFLEVLGLDEEPELAVVEFRDEDFIKAVQDFPQVIGKGVEVAEDDAADSKPFVLHPVDRGGNGTFCAAPSEDEQFPGFLPVDGCRGQGVCYGLYLVSAEARHFLVVNRIVADTAGFVLFEPADAVFVARHAGEGEFAGEGLGVAFVGNVFLALLNHTWLDWGEAGNVRDPPGFGTDGDIEFAQEDDRAIVLQGDPHGFAGGEEAVGCRGGGHDGAGEFPVFSVVGQEEVALLGLGGETCTGATPLDINDNHGKFGHGGEPDEFAFEAHSRATGGSDPNRTCEARPEGDTDGGNFVFGLYGFYPEMLLGGKAFQNGGGGGDGVTGEEEVFNRTFRTGDEAVDEGVVTVDLAVGTWLGSGPCNLVAVLGEFGSFTEEVTGLESLDVGFGYFREPFPPLAVEEIDGGIQGAVVNPVSETEGEEVFTAGFLSRFQRTVREGFLGHVRDVDFDQGVLFLQCFVIEWVFFVTGFGQISLFEGLCVDDQEAAFDQFRKIGLEGGRVHCHQRIWGVPGGMYPAAAELDLEAGHTGQSSRWGTDFSREIRQGGQVVPCKGAAVGKLLPDNLHPVPGIPGKSDDDGFPFFKILRCCAHVVKYGLGKRRGRLDFSVD